MAIAYSSQAVAEGRASILSLIGTTPLSTFTVPAPSVSLFFSATVLMYYTVQYLVKLSLLS